MAEINWKSKYNELKAKYMSSVDTAFRLGMEQGMQQAQVQQAQDQAAQAQTDAQNQQVQPGQEEQDQEGEQPQDSAHPQGSELDQHISTLEGMLGKSELTDHDMTVIMKSLKDLKFGIEMKKSDLAVSSIARALVPKAPVLMNKAAVANLNPTAKAALSMQEQIVANVMAGLAEEEKHMSKSITDIVAGEGLKKD